jgi:VanZ family protein
MTNVFYLIQKISTATYRALAWLWLILTLTLSLLSRGTMSSLNLWEIVGIDKVGHMGFYAILSFLWSMALQPKSTKDALGLLLSIVAFGICMEYCQFYFTAGRAFEWLDAIANSVGTSVGYFFYLYVINVDPKSQA